MYRAVKSQFFLWPLHHCQVTKGKWIASGRLWLGGGADIFYLFLLILVGEDQVKKHEPAVPVPACVQKLHWLAERYLLGLSAMKTQLYWFSVLGYSRPYRCITSGLVSWRLLCYGLLHHVSTTIQVPAGAAGICTWTLSWMDPELSSIMCELSSPSHSE